MFFRIRDIATAQARCYLAVGTLGGGAVVITVVVAGVISTRVSALQFSIIASAGLTSSVKQILTVSVFSRM